MLLRWQWNVILALLIFLLLIAVYVIGYYLGQQSAVATCVNCHVHLKINDVMTHANITQNST